MNIRIDSGISQWHWHWRNHTCRRKYRNEYQHSKQSQGPLPLQASGRRRTRPPARPSRSRASGVRCSSQALGNHRGILESPRMQHNARTTLKIQAERAKPRSARQFDTDPPSATPQDYGSGSSLESPKACSHWPTARRRRQTRSSHLLREGCRHKGGRGRRKA